MRSTIAFIIVSILWINEWIERKKDNESFVVIAEKHNKKLDSFKVSTQKSVDSICDYYDKQTIVINLKSK